jgi:hypothetical protein
MTSVPIASRSIVLMASRFDTIAIRKIDESPI